jgi:hypothetical protein
VTDRTVTFYKTNSLDDPGFDLTVTEVAQRFWASDEGKRWLAEGGELLARCALRWLTTELGGWGMDRTIFEDIEGAILDHKPVS